MFDMDGWQIVVIGAAALLSVGVMITALLRLETRRAGVKGWVRRGSAVEAALVGGTVPGGARVWDGWAYRVGARFAGRVRVAVYEETVAVAGPRVPKRVFQVWMWLQSILLALVLPALVGAVVLLDWRWLLGAVALFVVSFCVSMGGAGLWPGLGELEAGSAGGYFLALEFPRGSVHDVDIGEGWSKGGLAVVLFPYKAGVDRTAVGRTVSFFAPDEDGREVRFAVDMYTASAADELASALRAGGGS